MNDKYDNFEVRLKKRDDGTLIVFVDYYKNGKLIEQKRTTNEAFIKRILDTATSTLKEASMYGSDLKANYQKRGSITIEDYNSIKNTSLLSSFASKVDRKFKNKFKKEEKAALLSGVKNLKVTKNKSVFKKIALKTGKLIPLATLAIVVMSQVMPIVKNLPDYHIYASQQTVSSQYLSSNLIQPNDIYAKVIHNDNQNNQDILVPVIENSNDNLIDNQGQTDGGVHNSIESTSTEDMITPEVAETPAPTSEVTIPEVAETPAPTSEVTIPEVAETPAPTPEITIPEVAETPALTPEVTTPEVAETPAPTPEITISEVAETPALTPEVTIPEVAETPAPTPEITIPEVVEDTSLSDNQNENITISDTSGLSDYASQCSSEIFKSNSYADSMTPEEKIKFAAIIAGEDSYTYEGSLAAASTVLNRCDTERFSEYGGQDPYKQLTAPSQFTAKDGSLAKNYMNHPEQIPDYVMAAVNDALNGYRNHNYVSFRASSGSDRTQIGSNGNWYFNQSSQVPNYGYIDSNNKSM